MKCDSKYLKKLNQNSKDKMPYEIIEESIKKNFGNRKPARIIMEPGRYLVANAGVIETEVILVSDRGQENNKRWVYIDVGRYNGLAETEDEAIHYEVKAKGYKNFLTVL